MNFTGATVSIAPAGTSTTDTDAWTSIGTATATELHLPGSRFPEDDLPTVPRTCTNMANLVPV